MCPIMKSEIFTYKDKEYRWTCEQDSQHPDFTLFTTEGEIWVQVEINQEMVKHNELYFKGKVDYPISMGRVELLVTLIVEGGYIENYLKNDYGLTLREGGFLVET